VFSNTWKNQFRKGGSQRTKDTASEKGGISLAGGLSGVSKPTKEEKHKQRRREGRESEKKGEKLPQEQGLTNSRDRAPFEEKKDHRPTDGGSRRRDKKIAKGPRGEGMWLPTRKGQRKHASGGTLGRKRVPPPRRKANSQRSRREREGDHCSGKKPAAPQKKRLPVGGPC